MEPAVTQAAHDDLDDLFNYNAGGNDPLEAPEQDMEAEAPLEARRPKPVDLGIDEEIKQRVKRPNPKLDEDRLLSQNGIPKLRRITKERLKFEGKGHEFSDIARLLNLYQLWLDDLYPKAKFVDGLAMIEKLGHSKRLQTMRKEWIDESKMRRNSQEDSLDIELPANRPTGFQLEKQHKSTADRSQQTADSSDNMQHNEDSLFVGGDEDVFGHSEPQDDELDELMAETGAIPSAFMVRSNKQGPSQEPDKAFDDAYAEEMEMMRDLGDW